MLKQSLGVFSYFQIASKRMNIFIASEDHSKWNTNSSLSFDSWKITGSIKHKALSPVL